MPAPNQPIHGRGASSNPPNHFERLVVLPDPDATPFPDDQQPLPRTRFFRDASRSVLSCNKSPDIGFEYSLNPYRGCEHGCIYCYARPWHENFGFSAGLDFESKIIVKDHAPQLLRQELSSPRWRPVTVVIGPAADCYQPVERRLKLTRRCLEVFADFRNPISVITKNHLVTRDIDILSAMAAENLAQVSISITTLDPHLTQILEPRTSVPRLRLAAIEALASAHIPVCVLVAPIIPGLTDHEMPAIIEAAAKAGAQSAAFQIVRLPGPVAGLFEHWLEQHMPHRKAKVLDRIRAMRGGKLDDPVGRRMHTEGVFSDQISQVFELACRRHRLNEIRVSLDTTRFRRPADNQLTLF